MLVNFVQVRIKLQFAWHDNQSHGSQRSKFQLSLNWYAQDMIDASQQNKLVRVHRPIIFATVSFDHINSGSLRIHRNWPTSYPFTTTYFVSISNGTIIYFVLIQFQACIVSIDHGSIRPRYKIPVFGSVSLTWHFYDFGSASDFPKISFWFRFRIIFWNTFPI